MFKLIVVDDEEIIRRGLIKIISREENVEIIGEAGNGIEALEIIGVNPPDVVITDIKMPYMDGLELINHLSKKYPKIKKIVLSGFDEFSYAREALRNNVVDYLLKPIDDVELIGILKKIDEEVKRDIIEESHEMLLKSNLNQSASLLVENLVRQIVSKKGVSEEQIFTELKNLNYKFNKGIFAAMVISLDNSLFPTEESVEGDIDLKYHEIRGIAEESVTAPVSFLSALDKTGLVFIISTQNRDQELIRKLAQVIFDNLKMRTKLCFTISLGNQVDGIAEVRNSFCQAVNNIKYRFYQKSPCLIFPHNIKPFENAKDKKHIIINHMDIYKNILKNYIELGRYSSISGVFEGIGEKIPKSNIEPFYAIKLFSDLFIGIESAMPDFKKEVEDLYGFDFSYSNEVYKFETFDRLITYSCELYTETVKSMVAKKSKKDKKIVEIVKDYVSENYFENITLTKIAEMTYVNPNYFCEMFKKETGENFVDYLTRVRIEQAKLLLKDIRIKAYKVGEMVGYEDPAYFSKVFKKVVGVSPSEYRNTSI